MTLFPAGTTKSYSLINVDNVEKSKENANLRFFE
jgi:hypothetical protein